MAKDMMAQEFSPQEDSYWIRDLCDWSGHKDCWPNAVKDPSVYKLAIHKQLND